MDLKRRINEQKIIDIRNGRSYSRSKTVLNLLIKECEIANDDNTSWLLSYNLHSPSFYCIFKANKYIYNELAYLMSLNDKTMKSFKSSLRRCPQSCASEPPIRLH